ncbi:FkbM family methyltransferase [soil metagenome]
MIVPKNTEKFSDLIYDVGLHHGQDTDFYLKKGYRVVAFEADPGNAAFCRTRFASEIGAGRLTIVEGAITEDLPDDHHESKVKFYRNAHHSLWGSTSEDWAIRNEVLGTRNDIIKVQAIDFAGCVEKHGVPHYLKADIVGSEMICLRALLNFTNKPDYLSIRSEKLVFRKLEYEFELLEELGYVDFKAVKQDFEGVSQQLPSTNGAKFHDFEEGASGPFGEDSSGQWKTASQVLAEYKRIFVKYWLFGDYSYLIQTHKGRRIVSQLERLFRTSIPGWYDTHARQPQYSDQSE